MNKRYRFLIISLAAVIVTVVGYQAWRLFQIRDRLQHLVKSRLEVAFGPNVRFDELTLGLGIVHLRSVQFMPTKSSFHLLVDELSVGFNVLHLLSNGFEPERTATKIILTHPRLLVYRSASEAQPVAAMAMDLPREMVKPQNTRVKDYAFIDNVTISNGQIILIDSLAGVSSLIADEVSGWLESQGEGKATAKMAGHLFSSNSFDLVVEAGIDFLHGGLNYVQASLHNHRISNDIPFLIPGKVKILDGRLNGTLRIAAHPPGGRGYDIAGRFYLRDGAVEAEEGRLAFRDIDLDIDVADWNLRISKARQLCNGSPMTFSGAIYNITKPRFDLTVNSDSLSLRNVMTLFNAPAHGDLDGTIKLQASIRDSLPNLRVEGKLSAADLKIGKSQLSAASARFVVVDSVIAVQELTGNFDGVHCKGWGEVRLHEEGWPVDFDLLADGDFSSLTKKTLHVPLSEVNGTLVMHASGPAANPRFVGRFEVMPNSSSQQNVTLLGNFTFVDRNLEIETASAQNDLRLNAVVSGVSGRPSLKMRGRGLERVFHLLGDSRLAARLEKFRIDASAEGPLDSLNMILSLTDRAHAVPLLQSVSSLTGGDGEPQNNGYVRVFPGAYNEFTVRYQSFYRDSTIYVTSFGNENWLEGSLEVALGGDQRVRGKMKISGADFSRLVEGIERETPNYAGRFFADLKFAGTLRSPSLSGNLWLLDGFLHGVGSMVIETDMRVDRSGLRLAPFEVQKDGVPFLRAAGGYDFSTHQLDIQASAKNIDAADFLQAAAGVNNVLRGRATFDLQVAGAGPRVPIYGSIELSQGTLVWFSYDRLLLDFGESQNGGNGSYASSQAIYAARAVYEKDGNYRMSGDAVLPLTTDDSLRVVLSGDGNFLSIVRDFTDYFEEPRSSGHLELQLSGSYGDLKLHDSNWRFTDGFMRLGNIAHAVTDLSGDLSIDSRGEFVEVQQLGGQIGDAMLTIQNQEAPVSARQHLSLPFRLFDSDLSLGTLIINSSSNGLLLHVPGLMEGGETGRFVIRGRDQEKGFLIAGPWAHPKFRGQVELEGVNFMFPFDVNAEPPDSLLMEILWNIDWDVRVISRKDNRYVQKVPSPLDNVYVNIGVDDNVSMLEFSGIIADSSFRTQGHAESTRGNVEYLDLNFRVEKFGIDFDKNDLWPAVYGRAWTVFTDSTNFPQNIYLTLHTSNKETGEEFSGGRWEDVYFKLSSDNPNFGGSQAQILAALGYSVETVGARATEAVGTATDNRLFRPLFRPVERRLERHLGLDIVRLSSRLARNFIEFNLGSSTFESRMALWRHTKLTLGKYLSDDIYFLYNGQIEAGIDYRYHERGYGLRHVVGLEYRVNPTLLLQMEYDYNSLLLKDKIDRKLWLRHSFPF